MPDKRITITWTPKKRDRLRRAYENALRRSYDDFVFDGHTLVVAYAKYLLEFLDQQFSKHPLGTGHKICD